MRPRKREASGSGDLFRSRLEQVINMKHELVRLAREIDWDCLVDQVADCFSVEGRPGTETRFMVGQLLLKHIYGLPDEGICERWAHDPYFQYFTGEAFFQHGFPHERSGLTHWRGRLGEKIELLLAETLRAVAIPGEAASLGAEEAARAATNAGFQARASAGVAAALGEIVRDGGRDGGQDGGPGRILICGSLYLAGHVLGENA